MPPAFGAPSKKKGPLFWILIVVGVMFVLGFTIVGFGGYFLYRAASDVVDTELFQSNPALAAAKLAVSLNPDLEEVSIDESTGTLTVREKSSGKVVQMRLDPKTKSLITVTDDGSEVRIGEFGAAELPDWLAPYPGSTPQANVSAKTKDSRSLTFHFKTSDEPKKVLDFYADQAAKAGLEVNSNSVIPGGGMLLAEKGSRQLVVTVGATGDVSISVSEGN
jgi:hypothetical protein